MNLTRGTMWIGLIASVSLVGTACAADAAESADAFIAWAREHAQPIRTIQPGGDLDDLQGLKAIVGDARVVAIGESEHYIGEFFRLKHRMFEFLVKEMGFNAVALESGLGDSKVLYDYVLGAPAVPGMWDTGLTAGHAMFQETRDMVEWMRSYNADPKNRRKLHLYGAEFLGFNGTWMPAVKPLVTYLEKVDPGYAAAVKRDLVPLIEKFERTTDPQTDPIYHTGHNVNRSQEAYAQRLSAAEKLALTGHIGELMYRMELMMFAYRQGSSDEEFDWAYQLAVALRQADRYRRYRPHPIEKYANLSEFERSAPGNIRASAVRENVRWMLERGDKVVLMVHNLHLMRSGDMGKTLADLLGEDYVTLGATYSKGTTITEGLSTKFQPVEQAASTHEGLDGVLAEVDLPMFLLDLGQVPKEGPVRDWLSRPRKTRAIGQYYGQGIAIEDWDGLYFIREIHVGQPAQQSH